MACAPKGTDLPGAPTQTACGRGGNLSLDQALRVDRKEQSKGQVARSSQQVMGSLTGRPGPRADNGQKSYAAAG